MILITKYQIVKSIDLVYNRLVLYKDSWKDRIIDSGQNGVFSGQILRFYHLSYLIGTLSRHILSTLRLLYTNSV